MVFDGNLPVVDLYIAPIPDAPLGQVCHPARQALLNATVNKTMRWQRYYVWKLLEYALRNSFGLQPENMQFSVDENGKWSCAECFFSLSHCKDFVAVAVSHSPVGVDIESLDRTVAPGLHRKVLTDTELEEYNRLDKTQQPQYLLEKWCAKESLFKATGGKQFSPRRIECQEGVRTGIVHNSTPPICYAVAGEHLDHIRIFTDIKL